MYYHVYFKIHHCKNPFNFHLLKGTLFFNAMINRSANLNATYHDKSFENVETDGGQDKRVKKLSIVKLVWFRAVKGVVVMNFTGSRNFGYVGHD